MGAHVERGFTIIETMLVLAITGVLVAALLVGIGTSIGIQRYRDSVVTLKSVIQDQYSKVSNVSNDRNANWSCSTTAKPVQGGATAAPGQSQCVLMGRYMSINDNAISMGTVVGYKKSSAATTNDIAEIVTNYNLGISAASVETTTLEWGARIAWARNGNVDNKPLNSVVPRAITILFLRSPTSGSTYTFTNDTAPVITSVTDANLKALLNAANSQDERIVCIAPTGGGAAAIPEYMTIYIAPYAQDASAIETRTTATYQTATVFKPNFLSNLGANQVCQYPVGI